MRDENQPFNDSCRFLVPQCLHYRYGALTPVPVKKSRLLLRAIGVLHGFFGVATIIFLISRALQPTTEVSIEVVMLLACAFTVWNWPKIAALLAAATACMYFFGVEWNAYRANATHSWDQLIPTFYIASGIRAAAAIAMWTLAKKVSQQPQSQVPNE